MKRFLIIGLVLFVVALASGCATVKVDNIVRFTQPIGKIEALTVKIESGFASSKEGTGLKKAIANELQKNGIKVEQITDIVLNVEIEDFQIPSAASR